MDRLEVVHFIIVCVDAHRKVEPGVAAIDDLVTPELNANVERLASKRDKRGRKGNEKPNLDKVGLELLVARRDDPVDLALELGLFLVIERHVPLGKPRLALTVLNQNKPNLFASHVSFQGGEKGNRKAKCPHHPWSPRSVRTTNNRTEPKEKEKPKYSSDISAESDILRKTVSRDRLSSRKRNERSLANVAAQAANREEESPSPADQV